MFVVIASANIFRREFSSYILSEAGHEVGEARTSAELGGVLRSQAPTAIVLDLQLDGADPAATLLAVRRLSDAPIVWIGEAERARPLLLADDRPGVTVSWPFRGDELTAAVAALLAQTDVVAGDEAPRARQVGSPS